MRDHRGSPASVQPQAQVRGRGKCGGCGQQMVSIFFKLFSKPEAPITFKVMVSGEGQCSWKCFESAPPPPSPLWKALQTNQQEGVIIITVNKT